VARRRRGKGDEREGERWKIKKIRRVWVGRGLILLYLIAGGDPNTPPAHRAQK
jgi:hypothetical protein